MPFSKDNSKIVIVTGFSTLIECDTYQDISSTYLVNRQKCHALELIEAQIPSVKLGPCVFVEVFQSMNTTGCRQKIAVAVLTGCVTPESLAC